MAADLQNLSRRHAFRIRQIAFHHHRITQRYGENHAQNTARHTQQRGLPKRETAPVAGHQEAGQDENNARKRTRRRSLRLHHIVFQNIAAFEKLQNRHRNHRRRNRRSESQADFQAEVNVGRGKHDGNQRAEYHAPQRQLAVVCIRIVGRLGHGRKTFLQCIFQDTGRILRAKKHGRCGGMRGIVLRLQGNVKFYPKMQRPDRRFQAV